MIKIGLPSLKLPDGLPTSFILCLGTTREGDPEVDIRDEFLGEWTGLNLTGVVLSPEEMSALEVFIIIIFFCPNGDYGWFLVGLGP